MSCSSLSFGSHPFAGSFATLYIGLILFLLARLASPADLAISANMQQAMLYSFVVMMPCALRRD